MQVIPRMVSLQHGQTSRCSKLSVEGKERASERLDSCQDIVMTSIREGFLNVSESTLPPF